jgi:hypothetical protein
MMSRMDISRARRLPRVGASGLSIVLIAACGAGCAHSDQKGKKESAPAMAGIPTPAVPSFLNGAMAVLLTNATGFRAHVVLDRPGSSSRSEIFSGELMSREGKLFFAPEPGTPVDKRSRAEDFSYIWNVEENRGFLLSGPLQGYAPISSNTRVTNVVTAAGADLPASQKVGGYACTRSTATVVSSDGSETALEVWRARDLKGMPVRITRSLNGAPLVLTLSKIRLESPPNDVFAPPTDFTRYSSAELMVQEFMARQENVKRKRGWQPPPSEEIGVQNPTRSGMVR